VYRLRPQSATATPVTKAAEPAAAEEKPQYAMGVTLRSLHLVRKQVRRLRPAQQSSAQLADTLLQRARSLNELAALNRRQARLQRLLQRHALQPWQTREALRRLHTPGEQH